MKENCFDVSRFPSVSEESMRTTLAGSSYMIWEGVGYAVGYAIGYGVSNYKRINSLYSKYPAYMYLH